MKKIFLMLFATANMLILNNCRDENNDNSFEEITNLKSTKKISETFLKLGVEGITKENNIIKFETFGDFLYKDKIINFSQYQITNKSNTLSTKKTTLFIDDEGDLSITNQYISNKKLNSIDFKNDLNEDDLILILTYLEFNSKFGKKTSLIEKEKEIKESRIAVPGCSFFNIRRAVGFGITESEADADLWGATINFANLHMGEGCRSIGGVSHKDVGFAVIAIQSFCCP